MIKTARFALIFLTSQNLFFCERPARGSTEAPRVLSGPHAPDHSAKVGEVPGLHPYLAVRSEALDPASEARVRELVAAAEAEGLRPVLVCGQVQGLALASAFPQALIVQPGMLVDAPVPGGKAAPGLAHGGGTLPTPEEAAEILAALGY